MSDRTRGLLAVLAIVVAAGATVASGDENTASKVESDGSASSGNDSAAYAVGDEVKLGEWTVQVHAVADPQAAANEFLQPAAGTKWVGVDTEVKNLSSEPAIVSSLACFQLHDAANREYTGTIASGVTPQAPDGQIEPAGGKRGVMVFEVPLDATGLQLRFNCDLFDRGQAIINLA